MRVVIACRVMQAELEEVRGYDSSVEIIYLDQALHRTPGKMPGLIQEQIDRVSDNAEQVILGYGLCSKGVAGVKAGKQELIVPRAHDCIALLMGSCTAYAMRFAERPGTHYLSRGWLAECKDPLGVTEGEYTERVGREMAIWVMQEELKHYTHITLIKSGNVEAGIIERAQQNAAFFGKEYDEIPGGMEYFQKIVDGPYESADFCIIPPGGTIQEELWFSG